INLLNRLIRPSHVTITTEWSNCTNLLHTILEDIKPKVRARMSKAVSGGQSEDERRNTGRSGKS
uniref:Uncharacterized protein n=1 Tax=Dicentrarchus labrax TaxID=13489 RepID=A0A8C4HER4_DICLA